MALQRPKRGDKSAKSAYQASPPEAPDNPDTPFKKLMKGVIAYVDCLNEDNTDAGVGIAEAIASMGGR